MARDLLNQLGIGGEDLTALRPGQVVKAPQDLTPERIAELSIDSQTPFGRLTHFGPIAQLSDTPARYGRPALPLDHDPPEWLTSRLDATRSG